MTFFPRSTRPARPIGSFVSILGIAAATALLVAVASAQTTQTPAQAAAQGAGQNRSSGQTQGSGQGRGGMRGMGSFPGGGRGVLGTVTEVAADHYTIKTESAEVYTVHFSVNTRIMKQPAGQRPNGPRSDGQGGTRPRGDAADGERQQPQAIKPADIKVGDAITAGGEVDAPAKSIGAVFILQLDPERAKEMRAMQANYGKTWLAGKITGIEGTTITIDGMIDHASHVIAVDENTSFRKRRDAITMADIKPGDQLRAEGAVKDGVFLATTVTAMNPPNGAGSNGPNGPGTPPGAPQQ